MAENILEAYLVKLGATVDSHSFTKFDGRLMAADKIVGNFGFNAVKTFAQVEASIIGSFAAVGAGVIAMADKTAMADQQYRLLGLRMLMGKNSARALSMALEDLGASLDEVAYDPELNRNATALTAQYEKMGKALGAGFDESMSGIRAIRSELKLFERELDFLTMDSVSKLFDAFGFGSGDALRKLEGLNDWFTQNIPQWSDTIAKDAIPVWNDFKVVMGDAGSMAKTFGGEFANLSGLLLGDSSIQSTEFNVKNLVKALQDWADMLTKIEIGIGVPFKATLHGMNAALDLMSSEYWIPGKDRDKFRAKADAEADSLVHDVAGMFSDKYTTGDDFAAYRAFHGRSGKELSDLYKQFNGELSMGSITGVSGKYDDLLSAAGQQFNVDPRLLKAMMNAESSGNPTAVSGRGAQGLMQLMPDVQKQYGVSNSFDPKQNIFAGAHLVADLERKYGGDVGKMLAAYNWGAGNFDRYGSGGNYLPNETQGYLRRVGEDYVSGPIGGSVTINNLDIHVPASMSDPNQIKEMVSQSIADALKKSNRRTIASTAGSAY